jgi:hypothetical protein
MKSKNNNTCPQELWLAYNNDKYVLYFTVDKGREPIMMDW